MNFRTEIKPEKATPFITHSKPVVMMGSCFTENIGEKFRDALFDVTVNPWGTLYNPVSIYNELNAVVENLNADRSRIIEYNGLYHSYDHHSKFSAKTSEEIVSHIDAVTSEAYTKLKEASALIITFGSATVFRLVADNSIVGNCHKLPAKMFVQQRLDINETVIQWTELLKRVIKLNPSIRIIFTVSPIRYKAYGFHNSQLDKARLLLISDIIREQINAEKGNEGRVIYFPSYEIMMDDLRDYRFYAQDMIHPSEVAVNYIYEIFSRQFFSEKTMSLAAECEGYTRRLNHRFLTDNTEEINKFNNDTEKIRIEIESELKHEI